jgi:phage terminase Nu1 subunit (DNA packaging protein)
MDRKARPDNVVAFRQRPGQEGWVTARRLADHFQVSVRTVQRWVAIGMPHMRIGGTVRFQISAAELWLREAG